jgi:hypothetical protein
MYVAHTCESALMHQNSDGDEEIAAILRSYCGEKIYVSMQETAQMLALLDGKGELNREADEIGQIMDAPRFD